MKEENISIKQEKPETTYSKAQLVKSQRYKNQRDIISFLLSDNKCYTFKEVNELISDFLRKGVK